MEICSEKNLRNRLGTISVIPRKKLLIPRNSEVYGTVNSEARNGTELHEKISITKISAPANRTVFSSLKTTQSYLYPAGNQPLLHYFINVRKTYSCLKQIFLYLMSYASERKPESLLSFLFYWREFRVVFSSAEWFGTEFCSAEQPEFRRDKPIVPSIPTSGE
jgi:hypothetical protein